MNSIRLTITRTGGAVAGGVVCALSGVGRDYP